MKIVVAVAAAALLAGCSAPPVIEAGADPADPGTPVRPVRYVPVTAGTVDIQPVEPKPWTEQNQRVAPPAGQQVRP